LALVHTRNMPPDDIGPYHRLSTREIYRNPWFRLREDVVIRPGGAEGIFAVLEMKPGSSVLALDDEGDVYFAEEYKYAFQDVTLEVISGGIDEGETPLEAAKRELREEAGLEAEDWQELAVLHPFTTAIDSPNHMFLARKLRHTEQALDDGEVLHVRKVPLSQAVEMAVRGEIVHGASCVLILKVAKLLAEHKL
jgi:8-oxo-dGTP pyrophosphatase MutT (NUDIX family)